MGQQFQLRGQTLEALESQVFNTYGPQARIVKAERVLNKGLGGLLGKWHVEVNVYLPDQAEKPGSVDLSPVSMPHTFVGRTGIAALLAEADRTEAALQDLPGIAPVVSTEAEDFEALLQKLRAEVVAEPESAPPSLLANPGDLVLVLGLGGAALEAARSMAPEPGKWELRTAGEVGEDPYGLPDRIHLEGPRSATAARARAVETGKAVVAAYNLGSRGGSGRHFGLAAALNADQVWLVVDARHKPEDTAEWVSLARASLRVAALAVTGAADTSSPHTVNSLGIPIGWVDGTPAPRTVL